MTMSATETLGWCLAHFKATDEANAALHVADVKYSPITFRVAETLYEIQRTTGSKYVANNVLTVLAHRGAYEEDEGR